MPITTKLEDGTEIEALTPDEVEAAKQEAIEQYKLDNPDKEGELAELQTKLQEAEEKLAKAGDKDKNFDSLRKAKETAEKKVEDILKGVDEKINTVKKEVMEGVMKDHYNDTLKAFAGEDAEVQKKIEYHFKRLGDVASTKEEITNKLKDAYLLATGKEDNGVNASVFSSGGVGRLNIKSDKKFSSEEIAMGEKFGLTPKDFGQK